MNSQKSESQVASDRSFVDLGLMLTEKFLTAKTKLKEINPTLIYQWDGQTLNNQVAGKGIFRVRNSLTNELIFQCQVKKWKNGSPQGNIIMKKINFFSNNQIADYKMKQIQMYEGGSENLKKHGKGTYTFQQFYSSGKVKKSTIIGSWSNDILIEGTLQNQTGKKQLSLTKNVQWSKSAKSIAIDASQNPLISERKQEKQIKQKQTNILKENTKLMSSNTNLTHLPELNYKHKYLDPVKLR